MEIFLFILYYLSLKILICVHFNHMSLLSKKTTLHIHIDFNYVSFKADPRHRLGCSGLGPMSIGAQVFFFFFMEGAYIKIFGLMRVFIAISAKRTSNIYQTSAHQPFHLFLQPNIISF